MLVYLIFSERGKKRNDQNLKSSYNINTMSNRPVRRK